MKRLASIISILMVTFTVTSSATNLAVDESKTITGNGNIVKREIKIKDYQKFTFGGSATIVYEQKENASPFLRIEIDENIYPLIEINSSNNELKISFTKTTSGQQVKITPTKYIIYTNSTSLAAIDLAGSIHYTIKGKVSAQSLIIKVAGNTTLNSDHIAYNSLLVNSAGSSKICLAGEANTVSCNTAGNGNIDLLNLNAKDVKCSTAGSGIIKVNAEKTLNAKIAGSGQIEYKGNPDITKSVAGSGKVVAVKR